MTSLHPTRTQLTYPLYRVHIHEERETLTLYTLILNGDKTVLGEMTLGEFIRRAGITGSDEHMGMLSDEESLQNELDSI